MGDRGDSMGASSFGLSGDSSPCKKAPFHMASNEKGCLRGRLKGKPESISFPETPSFPFVTTSNFLTFSWVSDYLPPTASFTLHRWLTLIPHWHRWKKTQFPPTILWRWCCWKFWTLGLFFTPRSYWGFWRALCLRMIYTDIHCIKNYNWGT